MTTAAFPIKNFLMTLYFLWQSYPTYFCIFLLSLIQISQVVYYLSIGWFMFTLIYVAYKHFPEIKGFIQECEEKKKHASGNVRYFSKTKKISSLSL